MEKEIKILHHKLDRSKVVIFVIVAFLALLSYALVTISNELANVQTTESEAFTTGYAAQIAHDMASQQQSLQQGTSSQEEQAEIGNTTTDATDQETGDGDASTTADGKRCYERAYLAGTNMFGGLKETCHFLCNGDTKYQSRQAKDEDRNGFTQERCEEIAQSECCPEEPMEPGQESGQEPGTCGGEYRAPQQSMIGTISDYGSIVCNDGRRIKVEKLPRGYEDLTSNLKEIAHAYCCGYCWRNGSSEFSEVEEINTCKAACLGNDCVRTAEGIIECPSLVCPILTDNVCQLFDGNQFKCEAIGCDGYRCQYGDIKCRTYGKNYCDICPDDEGC